MDDRTGTEEQQRLEHSMREEVEHTGHVTEAVVSAVTRYAEGHHHETDLRNGREGEHALDVGLHTGDHRREQRGKRTDHRNAHEHLGSLEVIHRKEACDQVDAGHDHRRGMDQRRYRGRTFHRVGQPDMQREHRRFTGTADKDQRHRPGHHRAPHEGLARSSCEDAAVTGCARGNFPEVECLGKVR